MVKNTMILVVTTRSAAFAFQLVHNFHQADIDAVVEELCIKVTDNLTAEAFRVYVSSDSFKIAEKFITELKFNFNLLNSSQPNRISNKTPATPVFI